MRAFGGIFIAIMLTWLPTVLRVIIACAQDHDHFPLWSFPIVITTITSHSIIHPLIEAALLPDIRKYMCFCTACWHKVKVSVQSRSGNTIATDDINDSGFPHNCTCRCLDIINASFLPESENESHLTHEK